MQEILTSAFLIPLQNMLAKIYDFLPNFFAMILILIIGFFLGFGVKILLRLFLRLIRFDKLSFRLGFSNILSKAGIRRKPSEFVVKIVYWLLFLIFVMLALNALKITALDTLITQFFLFLPNVLGGLLLFFAGYLVSILLARTVLIAAVNAELQLAKIISHAVQSLVLIFFLAVALEQVGIGESIVTAAFTIVFGGLVLAAAIALGLGGRDLGKEWLEKHFAKSPKKQDAEKNMWSHI